MNVLLVEILETGVRGLVYGARLNAYGEFPDNFRLCGLCVHTAHGLEMVMPSQVRVVR